MTAAAAPDPMPQETPVRRFVWLWDRCAEPPDVFQFLAEHRTLSARELADVLLIDQVRRWERDIGRPVEEYFARLPDVASREELRLELIVGEFRCRRRDPALELESFLARFPEHRAALEETVREPSGRRPDDADPTHAVFEPTAASAVPIIEPPAGHADASIDLEGSTLLGSAIPFTSLPDDVMRLLESRMHQQDFAPGKHLMRQGEPGDSLMILLSGIVEIYTVDENGDRHLHARTGRGQVMGEMALLTAEPRSANVVAVDAVRALVLPAETFHELARQHPVISLVLTQLVATRLGSRVRDVLAGKTFHGYRIVKRLGRGGMAIVYEAVETAADRRVALKMMSHRLVYDKTALAQFQREADLIESFEHENIVRMYGRFEAFRTYFIVMQFVDGRSLSDTIRTRGALPETEARKIIGQAACALAYAHGHDVVHRDVKPANLMLGCDGVVKLMDFGLARPVIEGAGSVPEGIVGTPRYMAPEQLLARSAGKAADLFALGCVAYEILTGRPLLPRMKLNEQIQFYEAWQPPSFADIRPPLSADLCDALGDSLHLNPEHRRVDLNRLCRWAAPADPALIARRPTDPPEDTAAEETNAS